MVGRCRVGDTDWEGVLVFGFGKRAGGFRCEGGARRSWRMLAGASEIAAHLEAGVALLLLSLSLSLDAQQIEDKISLLTMMVFARACVSGLSPLSICASPHCVSLRFSLFLCLPGFPVPKSDGDKDSLLDRMRDVLCEALITDCCLSSAWCRLSQEGTRGLLEEER